MARHEIEIPIRLDNQIHQVYLEENRGLTYEQWLVVLLREGADFLLGIEFTGAIAQMTKKEKHG